MTGKLVMAQELWVNLGHQNNLRQVTGNQQARNARKAMRTCRWRFLGTAGWQAFAQDGVCSARKYDDCRINQFP
ncbi:hypothetical protein AVEN_209636-1 [Araneus ventricosus]|uniref:Uncharacterized protein n=1 Tax=Araneus ventricosus TaxID=182803 RepID=A0A4Y2D5D1_ARAVE|nr:hypothetical protein AVEN_209636-1 [Araneus ventricosus]